MNLQNWSKAVFYRNLCAIVMILALCILAGCSRDTETDIAVDINIGMPAENSADDETASGNIGEFAAEIYVPTFPVPCLYSVEINDGDKADIYPYKVETQTAIWYLSAEDIANTDETEFLTELARTLEYQDIDFADALAALKGHIFENIDKVDIYTDLGCKAQISGNAAAYYNGLNNMIKVFHDWESVRASLLHEYVHYLTSKYCTDHPVQNYMFSEGLADFFSNCVCHNYMQHSVECSGELRDFYMASGAWDDEFDAPDASKVVLGNAQMMAVGACDGQQYFAVQQKYMTRKEYSDRYPTMADLSYVEACSMMAYLDSEFGRDYLLERMSCNDDFEELFGTDFHTMYSSWRSWNQSRCREYGLGVPDIEF